MDVTEERKYASLPTISLAGLQAQQLDEVQRLSSACQDNGFFYLALEEKIEPGSGSQVLRGWTILLDAMAEYFEQDLPAKMNDHIHSDMHGYKAAGTSAGAEPNSKDFYENLKLSRDIMTVSGPSLPPDHLLNRHLNDICEMIHACERLCDTILTTLSDILLLKDSDRFEAAHLPDNPSTTFLGLLNYPKVRDISGDCGGHNKHTDIGSLTILLAQDPGLQVLTREGWQFVQPRYRHAVVNIGDSLRFLSRGRLKSCVHRVVPTAELLERNRQSICYFLRPESTTKLTFAGGKMLTAREWHDHKYDVFRQTHDQQEAGGILTGGMEKAGMLLT